MNKKICLVKCLMKNVLTKQDLNDCVGEDQSVRESAPKLRVRDSSTHVLREAAQPRPVGEAEHSADPR